MGNRFKDREWGEIEADDRGGAEAGTAGGVICFDVGSVQKGQVYIVFVVAEKVALQIFGKEIMKPTSASALMFFNC